MALNAISIKISCTGRRPYIFTSVRVEPMNAGTPRGFNPHRHQIIYKDYVSRQVSLVQTERYIS